MRLVAYADTVYTYGGTTYGPFLFDGATVSVA